MKDQLLAEETRHPGFSGFGVAGHQDVAAASGEREFPTTLQISEQQTTTALEFFANELAAPSG
jgi:hypothetical protein